MYRILKGFAAGGEPRLPPEADRLWRLAGGSSASLVRKGESLNLGLTNQTFLEMTPGLFLSGNHQVLR